MNKNPTRPENMDEIMSQVFNPKFKQKQPKVETSDTELSKYWKNQKLILKRINSGRKF